MYLVSLTLIIYFVSCERLPQQSRIIGGAFCDFRYPEVNYKFMISLRTYDEDFDFYEHFCGGTLLTEYWILTAGHCYKLQTMFAVEGHLIDNIEYKGPVTQIVSRIAHPKFDNKTNANDIALLLLAKPIFKSGKVSYVRLPCRKLPFQDLSQLLLKFNCHNVMVMGWGQTSKGNTEKWFPVKLECVNLNLTNWDDCRRLIENRSQDKSVSETNICTQASYYNDFWRGDSGGPLLCNDIQYGIISWGYGAQGYPSVYTRTDQYLDFIRENICRAEGA